MVVGILAVFSLSASAQTNVITVTNIVTVLETNIVSVTNFTAKTYAIAKTDGMNVTNEIVQPPKYPWDGNVGAGLTLTHGNSDTLLVTASILTHKKTPENEISLGADGAYGEDNSVENVDTAHGFSQYNHLFSDKFYAYARVDALHDGIADLQYRITIGPGVGYYFIKETNTTFAAEFGSSFVNQRLGNVDDNYATFRLAERFEHKFNKYGARVWENVEFLPQVNKFENYLVNAEVGVETSITKKISLKTFLQDNFANEPADRRQKNDLKLVSGVAYKF
jgi:putative salt-induced outer membrane protein YdiY